MSVRIRGLYGSTDGLRWGHGSREDGASFNWSYDMIGDRLHLWAFDPNTGAATTELLDQELADAARLLVRERVGLA